MKSEGNKSDIKLRPDAPVFVPSSKNVVQTIFPVLPKEPQCSRYSRKSVRRVDDSPNSPRPILGTKNSLPRPILGRKDTHTEENEENEEDYLGKEFRSIYRRLQKFKIADDRKSKKRNGKMDYWSVLYYFVSLLSLLFNKDVCSDVAFVSVFTHVMQTASSSRQFVWARKKQNVTKTNRCLNWNKRLVRNVNCYERVTHHIRWVFDGALLEGRTKASI